MQKDHYWATAAGNLSALPELDILPKVPHEWGREPVLRHDRVAVGELTHVERAHARLSREHLTMRY